MEKFGGKISLLSMLECNQDSVPMIISGLVSFIRQARDFDLFFIDLQFMFKTLILSIFLGIWLGWLPIELVEVIKEELESERRESLVLKEKQSAKRLESKFGSEQRQQSQEVEGDCK
jgi:hypothetical protein